MAEVRQINIELPEDLKPIFANVVRVAHTPGEFTLDFSAILPGDLKPKVNSRIVMSALGLKLLQRALTENIARYEANFGEIKLPTTSHTLADDLFHNSSAPQA
jgi:hypothetical protein